MNQLFTLWLIRQNCKTAVVRRWLLTFLHLWVVAVIWLNQSFRSLGQLKERNSVILGAKTKEYTIQHSLISREQIKLDKLCSVKALQLCLESRGRFLSALVLWLTDFSSIVQYVFILEGLLLYFHLSENRPVWLHVWCMKTVRRTWG